MLTSDHDQPIGVFDSGLGGLTVLKALKHAFPNENYIYLGDTARLPYGSKSPETISRYVDQTVSYLTARNVKAIIVACNSASGALISSPRDTRLPLYNVIEPGAQAALLKSPRRQIGILATRATVRGQAYVTALKKLDNSVVCYQQAAPLLVPLVEEGWTDDPLTNLVLHRYLQPMLRMQIDTLVLGCTHYPLLREAIQKICGAGIELVDSCEPLVDKLKKDFEENILLPRASMSESRIEILTTDSGDHFRQQAYNILSPYLFQSFEKVDL